MVTCLLIVSRHARRIGLQPSAPLPRYPPRSFRIRFYENCRVSVLALLTRPPRNTPECLAHSLFFSTTYKRPFPQPLSFDTVTNARGCKGVSPINNLKCYLKFSLSGCTLPSLFSLFAPRAFHKSFAFKRIRTLSENSRVAWVFLSKSLRQEIEVSASHSAVSANGTRYSFSRLAPSFEGSGADRPAPLATLPAPRIFWHLRPSQVIMSPHIPRPRTNFDAPCLA